MLNSYVFYKIKKIAQILTKQNSDDFRTCLVLILVNVYQNPNNSTYLVRN
jgi:hypothetical protein